MYYFFSMKVVVDGFEFYNGKRNLKVFNIGVLYLEESKRMYVQKEASVHFEIGNNQKRIYCRTESRPKRL